MRANCWDCGDLIAVLEDAVIEERQVSRPSHNDFGTGAGDFKPVFVHRDRLLCQLVKQRRPDDDKKREDERLSRQRIAAAAPDLLAALKAIVAKTEACDNPGDQGVASDSDEMQAARAAIAKAEGSPR